jgi:hypothetical protein
MQEDRKCLYEACWGIADHAQMLRVQGLSVPTPNPNSTITIQNEPKLQPARSPFCPITARTAAPDFRIRARDGSGGPLQAL